MKRGYKIFGIVRTLDENCVWWEYQLICFRHFSTRELVTARFYCIVGFLVRVHETSNWEILLVLCFFCIFACLLFIKKLKNSFPCLILWSKHLECWENTQEAGNHSARRHGFLCSSRVLSTSREFWPEYQTWKTVFELFYKIANCHDNKFMSQLHSNQYLHY